MDPNRPAIHALTAAVAFIRECNGAPGAALTAAEVAAIIDGDQLVEPITVPAAWLDNEEADRTFVPLTSAHLI